MANVHSIPVFTVDYTLDPDTLAQVFQLAQNLGYSPVVGGSGLETYVPTTNPGNDGTPTPPGAGPDGNTGPEATGDTEAATTTDGTTDPGRVMNAQRGIIGGGPGSDTFVLAPGLIDADASILISDGRGANQIHMIAGLDIDTARIAAGTLQLVLNSGAVVTVLDAPAFTYRVGGDPYSGASGIHQDYDTLVTETLGLVGGVPTSGVETADVGLTI